jgi:hypothetical protein
VEHHIIMSTAAKEDEFKDAVKLYIDLHDEIQKATKDMKEVKKRKDALGETILTRMRDMDIDVCQLTDGGKLIRKQSKRVEGLKKDHIIKELRTELGDESRAELVLNNIFSQRAVDTKESLQRTLK